MARVGAALCLLALLALARAAAPGRLRELPAAAPLQALAEGRPLAPRLPLPPAQQLDALRRVAQLLALIGEQVLPALADAVRPPAPGV